MKITLINGDSHSLDFSEHLGKELEDTHDVNLFHVEELDVKYCTGCWGCWVKTPGKCVFEDDSYKVLRSMINADLVIYISPLKMGFITEKLKNIMDRSIPLLHPYIEIVENECHHQNRYHRYPDIGLILDVTSQDEQEDIDITTSIFRRYALNFKSSLRFSLTTDKKTEGIIDEINHI